jgi:hypothetical protein
MMPVRKIATDLEIHGITLPAGSVFGFDSISKKAMIRNSWRTSKSSARNVGSPTRLLAGKLGRKSSIILSLLVRLVKELVDVRDHVARAMKVWY